MKKIIIVIGILVVIIALSACWTYHQIKQYAQQLVTISSDVYFTLPQGSNRTTLTRLLAQENISINNHWLPWLLRFHPELRHFKAGTYLIQRRMRVYDVLVLLASGKEAQFSIKFIEGSHFKDWRLVLKNAPYLQHTLDSMSDQEVAAKLGIVGADRPEGWLYPDTYHYVANSSDLALLKRAYQRMEKNVQTLWDTRAPNLPYKSSYEMLIMASIIEKESSVLSEKPIIASVFINRLNKNMLLQTDPTVIYGMGNRYEGKITKKDLQDPTVYNTYVIKGLPPTPISMVSLTSLQAAANPAKTNYYYFVADGYGKHVFSSCLADHNRAVQQYLNVLRRK